MYYYSNTRHKCPEWLHITTLHLHCYSLFLFQEMMGCECIIIVVILGTSVQNSGSISTLNPHCSSLFQEMVGFGIIRLFSDPFLKSCKTAVVLNPETRIG